MDVETSLNVGAEISCWGYIPMASSDTMIFFRRKGDQGIEGPSSDPWQGMKRSTRAMLLLGALTGALYSQA